MAMTPINYHGRRFKPVQQSANSETSEETVFHYQQQGHILHAEYSGGAIQRGHLIGLVDAQGGIDMRYHHVSTLGELMTGRCKSLPEILPNGRIRLMENWQWTSGDLSCGTSILEEF